MTSVLDFDPTAHEYRLDGKVIPSVTQVIGAVLPGWQASEWYMQRGTATHHGCRLSDDGVLDMGSVHPEIAPRIEAWVRFRRDWPSVAVAVECPLVHPLYRFAGTLDRVLERDGVEVIADLKSTIEPQVRLQLAAYSMLWTASRGRAIKEAVAVELREDGSYKTLWMDRFALRRAEQEFLATLTVFNFMQTHNLKGPNDGR